MNKIDTYDKVKNLFSIHSLYRRTDDMKRVGF
jgi:hypothetical protein